MKGIVVEDDAFAYLKGKRAVWVRRVSLNLYRAIGKAAFNQPAEPSKHSFTRMLSGRTKTTYTKKQSKLFDSEK